MFQFISISAIDDGHTILLVRGRRAEDKETPAEAQGSPAQAEAPASPAPQGEAAPAAPPATQPPANPFAAMFGGLGRVSLNGTFFCYITKLFS